MKPLPPRMRQKGRRLYYVHKQKWTPIGSLDDMNAAMRQYDAMELSLADPNLETMAGLMARFRAALEANRVLTKAGRPIAERTRDEYLRQLKPSGRIARVFGGMRLDSILPADLGEYLERHPTTIANREIALISRMYRYAIRRGYRGANPCLGLEHNPEPPRERYVTDYEYAVVRERASVSQRMFMALAYLYGTRLSAILSVRMSDIDREAGAIPIVDKGGVKSRLMLTPEVDEVIGWHLDQQWRRTKTFRDAPTPLHDRRPLIRNSRGAPWTRYNWAKYWRKLLDECLEAGEIQDTFRPHDLRAKHATDLEEREIDAQLALGHTSPDMKKRYLRHPKGRKVWPLLTEPKKS